MQEDSTSQHEHTLFALTEGELTLRREVKERKRKGKRENEKTIKRLLLLFLSANSFAALIQ